tara:strand:- start:62 stop:805 length:744 start_codon:yes stop_codon:yes gene_type:complete
MEKSYNFDLSDTKNYNKTFKKKTTFYLKEYIVLVTEFIEYFEPLLSTKNIKKYNIVIKGIRSVNHIFLFLFLYTKNLSLTLYHCKKAFLYYIEFINQIGEEGNSYLQLNSTDAIIFIYKKSIFDINNGYKLEFTQTESDELFLKKIKDFTDIFEQIYNYMIKNTFEDKEDIINYNDKLIKLLKNLIALEKKSGDVFEKMIDFVDILIFKQKNNEDFFNILKKTMKNKKNLKLSSIEFEINVERDTLY